MEYFSGSFLAFDREDHALSHTVKGIFGKLHVLNGSKVDVSSCFQEGIDKCGDSVFIHACCRVISIGKRCPCMPSVCCCAGVPAVCGIVPVVDIYHAKAVQAIVFSGNVQHSIADHLVKIFHHLIYFFQVISEFVQAKKHLPFFLVYYICNSISINCYSYFEMGKKPWVNTTVMAVFNALAPVVMVIVMYSCFFITGHLPSEFVPWFGGSIIGIWLYPIIVILPVAAVVSRILYKRTRNPYLAGILMALLVTTMSCTNTLTQL